MGAKREPLERVAFVVLATVGARSQIVADATKYAVQRLYHCLYIRGSVRERR